MKEIGVRTIGSRGQGDLMCGRNLRTVCTARYDIEILESGDV